MNTNEKLDKKVNKIKQKIWEILLKNDNLESRKLTEKLSNEANIGIDTIENLIISYKEYKKNKKDFKMISYLSKITSSEVNLYKDVFRLEQKVKQSKENFYKALSNAKYESLVYEIDSKDINKNILEYLKANDVSDKIFQKALHKYTSNVKINFLNLEETCAFLFKNNYKPNNTKNVLDIVYKYYADCKEKEREIRKLENQIIEKDDIICGKCNIINSLNTKIEYYEQTIPDIKSQLKYYVETAQKNEFNVKQLQKQLEDKERRSLISIACQKIKLLFQKDKPALLSASLKGIQSEMSSLTLGLEKVGDSIMQKQEEKAIKSFKN